MGRRIYYGLTLLVAIAAILIATRSSSSPTAPPMTAPGKNNTILFVTTEQYGLSNVHVATAYALLETQPGVKVHFASFPEVQTRIKRVSALAQKKEPSASAITFHPLPGTPYGPASPLTAGLGGELMMHPPGIDSADGVCAMVKGGISPWPADEYYDLYKAIRETIEEVDPAVVAVDMILTPAVDAARDMSRQHAILTPNVLSNFAPSVQAPHTILWKYPASGSGFPFPLPWSLIPANTYLNIQLIRCMLSSLNDGGRRDILKSMGIQKPLDFLGLYKPEVPWITQTLPGAHVPLDNQPSNIVLVGPINLAGVGEDGSNERALVAWIKRAPTMMIALGSIFEYNEQHATAMVEAIQQVLRQTDVQVLWKAKMAPEVMESVLSILDASLSDRLRIETWLEVEPPSLLQLDTLVASVHHGGAGCFHDALAGGVPQVILPMWIDLYDFASLIEYLGVGVWACRDMSPGWNSECLATAFIQVLGNTTESASTKQKATNFGDLAKKNTGRNVAAAELAKLASTGH